MKKSFANILFDCDLLCNNLGYERGLQLILHTENYEQFSEKAVLTGVEVNGLPNKSF